MNTVMVIYFKDNMLMILVTVMENIRTKMVQYIMEHGWNINNLVLDMKFGMIQLNIKVNIIME